MGYRRYYKRRSYRKRTYRKRAPAPVAAPSWGQKGASWGSAIGGSIGTLASTVKNIVESLNVEKKICDKTFSSVVDSAGSIFALHEIAQGTGNTEREGNKVKATTLSCRGNIAISSAATYSLVRLIIFKDTQQVADTAPTVTSVLESAHPLSLYNKNTLGRFQIIEDNSYSLHTHENPAPMYNTHKNLMHHLFYNGTANSDIQKGGLYCIIISDQGTNKPVADLRFRLRYVDN